MRALWVLCVLGIARGDVGEIFRTYGLNHVIPGCDRGVYPPEYFVYHGMYTYKSPLCGVNRVKTLCRMIMPCFSPSFWALNAQLFDKQCMRFPSVFGDVGGERAVESYVELARSYDNRRMEQAPFYVRWYWMAAAYGMCDAFLVEEALRSAPVIPGDCLTLQPGGVLVPANLYLGYRMGRMKPCPYPCQMYERVFNSMSQYFGEGDADAITRVNALLRASGYCLTSLQQCAAILPENFVCFTPAMVDIFISRCTNQSAADYILSVYSRGLTLEKLKGARSNHNADFLFAEWLSERAAVCQHPERIPQEKERCMLKVLDSKNCLIPLRFRALMDKDEYCMAYGGHILGAVGAAFNAAQYYNLLIADAFDMTFSRGSMCLPPVVRTSNLIPVPYKLVPQDVQ
ncbi:ORF24 [Ranid herpesvirus 1]|uniref:ORF24 n=1 Tax=Ranid herpesvirus 1 TaxID=85655 RepID=Q14VT4_9VIRU|nr:ORF24 [Ranid herpesvirus 1]ABG25729.1 ORF24 [Ranid herpesvirus 1]